MCTVRVCVNEKSRGPRRTDEGDGRLPAGVMYPFAVWSLIPSGGGRGGGRERRARNETQRPSGQAACLSVGSGRSLPPGYPVGDGRFGKSTSSIRGMPTGGGAKLFPPPLVPLRFAAGREVRHRLRRMTRRERESSVPWPLRRRSRRRARRRSGHRELASGMRAHEPTRPLREGAEPAATQ